MIGAGIVGCATAYNLAKRGLSVVLLEKGEVAGEQSSRNWGWVSQLRNPHEAQLQMLSQSLWPTLSDELNADLEWVQGGSLYLAHNEVEFQKLTRQTEIMQRVGMDVQMLSRSQARKLIPEINGDWTGAYHNRTNGHADPVKTTTAFARAAQESGVKLYTNCAVEGLTVAGGGIACVRSELGEIRTPIVICAAGAWSSVIGRMVGLNLPQRKVRATVCRTNPVPRFTEMNVWGAGVAVRQRIDGSLIVAGDGTADYDLTLDSFRHMKDFWPAYKGSWRNIRLRLGREFVRDIGRRLPWSESRRHPFAHTVGIEPEPNNKKIRDGMEKLQKLYPHLAGLVRVENAWAGYIDGTPDRIPVIGEVPGVDGFYFATGFSGHGFAMAPGTGQVMAELIVDGGASVDISAMRYTRFEEGILYPEPE
ncbi:MAG: FAD-binding oxidoreductase [Chloroflexi bacterium]|nr:FAD-binding oxidoreductase [Chloroflexota bacterium]